MIFSLLFFGIYFAVFAILLLLLFTRKPSETVGILPEKVKVSILIAARNEAQTIGRCLKSLEQLDYPPELLEVLIGDDGSEDETREVISRLIAGKSNFHLIPITSNLGTARGKGNVLAQLARQATSGFFFITDADIELPPTWITAMLASLAPQTGVVTGITTVTGSGFFARMQALEWLHNLGLIQVVSSLNLPVTAMGNNMLVTREAYLSTGGYENLPFSVTEDVQLYQEIVARGLGFKNVFHQQVLAETLPAPNLPELLHQRKRWMKGAMHLPLYMKMVLVLYASFYAVLVPFFFLAPGYLAFGILLLKWGCQSLFLQVCLKRVRRPATLAELLLYEGYQIITSLLLLTFYYLPVKVRWKGRKY